MRHYIELEQRRLVDQFNAIVHPSQHLRNSRSGRRSRRFLEHPYFLRNNLDNNTSNIRTHNNRHRVRFTSINRGYLNDHVSKLIYLIIFLTLDYNYNTLKIFLLV